MKQKGLNQSQLAEASGVSRDTIWRIVHQKTDPGDDILSKLSEAVGQPLPTLSLVPHRTHLVERGQIKGKEEIDELARDPDYEPEGSGLELQLEDNDVLDLLLFNRAGFTRYLMTRFESPRPLPMQAKLGFLDHLERIARERGLTVPTEHLEHLRGVIRGGGL